ncbi:MAG: ABC transporter ATP-binding protein [Planctomycetes bacterium]|nr:ABC transporter ATP-binding protein [Planctomycetota bacterium]
MSQTNAPEAIRTDGLTRYFGSEAVVKDLTLAVPRGSVFGLLGRNGSGKTTTIRLLLGLLAPTRGSAVVLGSPCTNLSPETRARIGYLAEGHPVFGWMRVAAFGRFQAGFYPTWNEDVFQGVLRFFQIDARRRGRDLSRGERAGLCLAATLAPDPELLVLDDPAIGLDPVARRGLLEALLYVTRREGRTVLFSSHVLADVERVADRVAVLDRGVLRACCTVDAFRERVRRVVLRFSGAPPTLPEIPGLLSRWITDGELRLTIANYDAAVQRILEGLPLERMTAEPLGLEEAFLDYVGDRGERTFFLQGRRAEA